ncbi:MAG: response regulator transcription factor [Rhodospirillales bacterium]|nr:response regulator transcription factor [Acetobacter sp.]
MWTPIRAVIVEDEPLAAQYLATLLDETWQVMVVGTASNAQTALTLCAEQRPDAAFLDIRLPGQDGVSLATQLNMLPQPPRIVFTTGQADRAAAAFRLEAVDYLLKPLDPDQVSEAVKRLAALLRPFEVSPATARAAEDETAAIPGQTLAGDAAGELLPVKDADRDQIRLLARNEVVAVLRRERRTWVHTVREEFATYYPVANLIRWLGGDPFLQVGRHAVVNLRAVEVVNHYGDRLYRLRLRDRAGSEVKVSRTGATRLAAALKRT